MRPTNTLEYWFPAFAGMTSGVFVGDDIAFGNAKITPPQAVNPRKNP
jgi:hypothetical protein